MADIFISHSSKDKATAMMICNYLEDNGLTCWISSRDIIAGSDWAASISKAINAAKVFLLIYSKNSAASEQVARELGIVETKKHIAIVPYKADDTPLTGSFEYFLTSAHWIFAEGKDYKLDELFGDISNIPGVTVRKPEPPPAAPAAQTTVPSPVAAAAPAMQSNTEKRILGMKKRSFITVCAASAVLLVGVGAILYLLFGKVLTTDPGTEPASTTTPASVTTTAPAETTTTAASTTTGTQAPETQTTTTTAAPDANAPKEVSVYFSGHICTGDYTGGINESGQPHGEGEFRGSYVNDDGLAGSVYYKGAFVNGECSAEKAYVEQEFPDGIQCVLNCGYLNGIEMGYGECDWTIPGADYTLNFKGNWRDGCYNGAGVLTYTYNDGTVSVYDGNFKDSRCDGSLVLTTTYPSDNEKYQYIYDGSWSEGTKSGFGSEKSIYANGSVWMYVGQFEDGKYQGYGKVTYTNEDGSIYRSEGKFQNGEPVDGTPFTLFSADGSVDSTGTWQNGEQVINS